MIKLGPASRPEQQAAPQDTFVGQPGRLASQESRVPAAPPPPVAARPERTQTVSSGSPAVLFLDEASFHQLDTEMPNT